MPKNSVSEWDTTAANNTDVGGVDLNENTMRPRDVNNAIRTMMSQIATGIDNKEFGVGGSTGATDNRLLRADGTDGKTIQASGVTLDDSDNLYSVGGFVVGAAAKYVVEHLATSVTPNAQVLSNGANASFLMARFSADTSAARIFFSKSRSGTVGAYGATASGDALGEFTFSGSDGVTALHGATISARQVGVAGADYIPSRIELHTSDGTAFPAQRFRLELGVYHPSATGGDKGDNTINFGAVYDDNTLLTCMAMQKEFIESGEIDIEKWDAMVPDQVVPEQRYEEPVTFTRAEVVSVPMIEEADGRLVRRMVEMEVEQKMPFVWADPIYDDTGEIVDAVETPVVQEIVVPEKIIRREHRTARLFKAMIEDGFDPRDPEQYFDRMKADEALPGMPNKGNWEHNSLSAGEMLGRLWLAAEMQAIVMNAIWIKLKALESRLPPLAG